MDTNLIELIAHIKSSNKAAEYVSFRNLFSYINIPLLTFEIAEGKQLLYRVRSHSEGNGDYLFKNISELSFRQDITNIRNFGRCNEPFQSRFYASNDEAIAFSEVADIARTNNKKDIAYFTTSVWKINQGILATSIVELDEIVDENRDLLELTKRCFEYLETLNFIPQKDDLKSLLKGIALEFTKPSSLDKDAYLFSAAYANYLFNAMGIDKKKIEGIVYPTCIDKSNTRNFGLNYVFNNSIVGFDNKIEFVDAYRSRLDKFDKTYELGEVINMKRANKFTGEIEWKH